jgi:hypothetical protein
MTLAMIRPILTLLPSHIAACLVAGGVVLGITATDAAGAVVADAEAGAEAGTAAAAATWASAEVPLKKLAIDACRSGLTVEVTVVVEVGVVMVVVAVVCTMSPSRGGQLSGRLMAVPTDGNTHP